MEENMYCQNRISYRVQEGDSLYKLAKHFHTTVTELILLNSGVNPYNLQVGMRLTICPGEGYVEDRPEAGNTGNQPATRPGSNQNNNQSNRPNNNPIGGVVIIPTTPTRPGAAQQPTTPTRPGAAQRPATPTRPGTTTQPDSSNGMDLRERMRLAWLNHIMLVKFYHISFFENLSSQNAWKDAVQKNAEDILAIFAQYYPASAMQRFRTLFMEHLRLTDEVADELKADPTYSGETMENWYINAEELASFLSRQTPAYNETELRKMFYDHLDMERQQMEAYLDGDYETDIAIYLRSQQNMIELADFLASGLLAR